MSQSQKIEQWEQAFDEWPGWRGNDPIRQAFRAGWDAAIASHAPSNQKVKQLVEACICAIRCIKRNSTQEQKDWTINHIEEALASHAPSPSTEICEKCGQEVIDGHWSLVCHKPACIEALQEVSMSYDLPVRRCFNLEDHSEHSWEYKNELHKCPGMPIQPSEAAAQPVKEKCIICNRYHFLGNNCEEAVEAEIEHNDH